MNTDERMAWFKKKYQEFYLNDEIKSYDLVEKLLETDYFTAPASTNKHHSYEGGLFDHSKKMYEELHKRILNTAYVKQKTPPFTLREAFVIGMFHDLCKVDLYIPNILKSGKVSEAKPYKKNNTTWRHGEISLTRAMKLLPDIEEKSIEADGIRWHMGFDELGYFKERPTLQKRHWQWNLIRAADLVAATERRDTA